MKISKHFQALKDYIGEKEVSKFGYEFCEIELHRCHFRITKEYKQFIFRTAAKLKWSANHLCNVMIEKCLPLVETALFKSKDEYDYDVIIQPEYTGVPRIPAALEHRYETGEYKENMFVVLDREVFLMLQYLKESLHFYSYSELFRLIVLFFKKNLDVTDCENKEEATERLRGVVGKIKGRLEKFRSTHILISTIVPINIRRIRATAACLYPPTQIFLEKMIC